MERRDFIRSAPLASLGLSLTKNPFQPSPTDMDPAKQTSTIRPLAITMWDFSWLERRWPGAGYEDWDQVLDELIERGYNAVRIDAYPHLVSSEPEKVWTLQPHWGVQDWGSPALNKVQVQPNLNEFLSKCKEREIWVGLSSWYRKDEDDTRMKIDSPQTMAIQWIKTLQSIEEADLLDAILYVDLCNEWPGDSWAPYFKNNPPELTWGGWYTTNSMRWMRESILLVRTSFPQLPLCYSFHIFSDEHFDDANLSFVDFLEPHIWMSQANGNEFYKKVGYNFELWDSKGYDNLARNAKDEYLDNKIYWNAQLLGLIDTVTGVSKNLSQPLITTECWGLVDYKDWPLLEWDWIKDLCAMGTEAAAMTGQWAAIATSNFCGPQFVGMWRDTAWHQQLTTTIKTSPVSQKLTNSMLIRRMTGN